MEALQHGVAALGEDLVQRDGDLPAKLACFALDFARRRGGPAVAPRPRSSRWSPILSLAVFLAGLGAQGTDLLSRGSMMSHDSSQPFGTIENESDPHPGPVALIGAARNGRPIEEIGPNTLRA
jgi:hypothetical protein